MPNYGAKYVCSRPAALITKSWDAILEGIRTAVPSRPSPPIMPPFSATRTRNRAKSIRRGATRSRWCPPAFPRARRACRSVRRGPERRVSACSVSVEPARPTDCQDHGLYPGQGGESAAVSNADIALWTR